MRTETYQRGDGEWVTHVYLSRRNLLSLLAKLDGAPATSVCTLVGPVFYPITIVTAEEDGAHYAHESRDDEPPGPLHPATEAAVARRTRP